MNPDTQLLLWINHAWAGGVADAVFTLLSDKQGFAFPLLIVLLADAVRREGRGGLRWWLLLVVLIALADALGAQLKEAFAEARPCFLIPDQLRLPDGKVCTADNHGMPSNHALNFAATWLFVRLTTPWRFWHWALGLAALGVMLSRVYLGVHYPSQVVFGAGVGLAVAMLAAAFYARRPVFGPAAVRPSQEKLTGDAR